MITKTIHINEIRPGMILNSDAVNRRNELGAVKNTVLSPRHVMKFRSLGIRQVSVMIPNYIATPEELELSRFSENPLKKTAEYRHFRKGVLDLAAALSKAYEWILNEPETYESANELIDMVLDIAKEAGSTLRVLEFLQCCRDFEDTIYLHTANVALISKIIGTKSGFNDTQLRNLIQAALFHDIGKLGVPSEVLNKVGPLKKDERELIKKHAIIGYTYLLQTGLPEFVALCALHHHERSDGSGYPMGLSGRQAPILARYVAVADVYNAMTSKRPYREEICPFEVISDFEKEGTNLFDSSALLPFLSSIAQSLIGSTVILSNGSVGKIIMLNDRLTRPTVQVGSEFVDLMQYQDINITKVI